MQRFLVYFILCHVFGSLGAIDTKAMQHLIKGNIKQALYLFNKSCESGDYAACYELGVLYSKGEKVQKDHHKSMNYYENACNGGVFSACNNLGVMFSEGTGVRQDYLRSLELYDKACHNGNADACNNLGVMFENGYVSEKRDYVQAGLYYTDACMGKSAKGCYNLGFLVFHGKGTKRDMEVGMEYFGLSCDFGFQEGCNRYKELTLKQLALSRYR
ncbi:MAG: sel1 repeat family protein [Helicobacter sp.]|nr:sel1 repeat family protein [Helicobacter sp.]